MMMMIMTMMITIMIYTNHFGKGCQRNNRGVYRCLYDDDDDDDDNDGDDDHDYDLHKPLWQGMPAKQ